MIWRPLPEEDRLEKAVGPRFRRRKPCWAGDLISGEGARLQQTSVRPPLIKNNSCRKKPNEVPTSNKVG